MTAPNLTDLSGLVIEVKITRGLRIRKAIGLWLITLACRVMRCSVEVQQEAD